MADRGHELTDGILNDLEQNIAEEYAVAVRNMQKKLEAYLEKDEAKRKIQEALLADGKITEQEYQNWCYRHAMMGKRWADMLDTLSKDMHQTNQIAHGMTMKKMPDVYALNANYSLYEIESGGGINTGLALYNHDTAEYLLEQQRQLMPGPSTKKAAEIAANKDLQWNAKKIQSAVIQGVLQGETPFQVAKRLTGVGKMNYNAAVRYARTMTTNAQNSGRYKSYQRAKDLGVELTIEWQAVLDGRTRHEHRMMHGQRRNVDEPFELNGVKIMWPGNEKCGHSNVPQEMIWNCRCTLRAWVKGFEGKTVKKSPGMEGMSFEEWQNADAQKKSRAISSPDEVSSRKSGTGRPSAVGGGADLNKRQTNLLNALQNADDSIILSKKGVSLRDLSALSAHEGVEFAMLTNKNQRMVIRGSERNVSSINEKTAEEYAKAGWKLSGHTHIYGGLIPSSGDIGILGKFNQSRSVIYDTTGKHAVFFRK